MKKKSQCFQTLIVLTALTYGTFVFAESETGGGDDPYFGEAFEGGTSMGSGPHEKSKGRPSTAKVVQTGSGTASSYYYQDAQTGRDVATIVSSKGSGSTPEIYRYSYPDQASAKKAASDGLKHFVDRDGVRPPK
jgi:hypothetical protein